VEASERAGEVVVREALKLVAGGAFRRALGRRNAVRLARFLLDQARLDLPNRIDRNGERLVQRAALEHGPDPLVVIDTGAHFGEWTAQLMSEAAALRRAPELHLFEPSQYAFERLQARFPGSEGAALTLNRAGLSARPGQAMLSMTHRGAGSASLHGSPEGPEADQEPVRLTTLDAYCAEARIARIDLLKCDAEGHDMQVLHGGETLLSEQKVALAQFEYNHRWIDARRYLRDAFEFLEGAGYELGKVTPLGIELYPRWDPELESFREGNYLAVARHARHWLPTIPWWKGT
jgi:FkbM family methyltransferase